MSILSRKILAIFHVILIKGYKVMRHFLTNSVNLKGFYRYDEETGEKDLYFF